VVGDRGGLYLRSATVLNSNSRKLVVISSEPLDRKLLDKTAAELGEIALYAANYDQRPIPFQASPPSKGDDQYSVSITESPNGVVMGTGQEELHLMFVAGDLPEASGVFVSVFNFGTLLPVLECACGAQKRYDYIVGISN